jgi:hypothetical protein
MNAIDRGGISIFSLIIAIIQTYFWAMVIIKNIGCHYFFLFRNSWNPSMSIFFLAYDKQPIYKPSKRDNSFFYLEKA